VVRVGIRGLSAHDADIVEQLLHALRPDEIRIIGIAILLKHRLSTGALVLAPSRRHIQMATLLQRQGRALRVFGGQSRRSSCTQQCRTRSRARAIAAQSMEEARNRSGVLPAAEPSPMHWKALNITDAPPDAMPSRRQVLEVLPQHVFESHTPTSLKYLAISLSLTAACAFAGTFIPLAPAFIPLWLAYSAVTGTVATGLWVLAHECGHGAFSKNRRLQTAVGYVLHSAMLVPYFSWQRSHAVHHAFTNHLSAGETHVPYRAGERSGDANLGMKDKLGEAGYGIVQLIFHFILGWPAYLLVGASGGPVRGITNHFWPTKPFSKALWPGKWKQKVWRSDIGVAITAASLIIWAVAVGSPWPAIAMYGGPLIIINCWLVGYTWLQHTDTDVPHLEEGNWSWVRGAFLSIDRPYGPVFDFLHHKIGSTHVAHHIDGTIPHYKAGEATEIIKDNFPSLYLYDPTPVHKALWRVARKCAAVEQRSNRWVFVENNQQVLQRQQQH